MPIDLTHIEDRSKSFAEEVELAVDRLDPDLVAGPIQVRLEGKIIPMNESFLVEASFEAKGTLFCTRCLTPVAWTGNNRFTVELRSSINDSEEEIELGEGDLDVIFLENSELDLKDLAAEQVMLGLPMRILCDPDCAGLCPKCGGNKNQEGSCTCEPDVDPRWEALSGLQGQNHKS
ncbi:MAG: DUF177 domain-containing protein [Thermoanaerobaculales bacterium]|nr:DUF177 domain-containing protein [Thermoanaerobaculales bacterium]